MNERIAVAVGQAVGMQAVVGTAKRRAWSWQIPVSVGESSLMLKVPRWEGIDSLDAAVAAGAQAATIAEYEALVDIDALVVAARDSELRAVRPIGFLEDVNGILMEWFDGATLRSVTHPFASRDRLTDVFKRAGRVVALLHTSAPVTRTELDVQSMVTDLAELVAGLKHPSRRIQRAAQAFSDRIVAMDPIDQPAGRTHGDLNLDNVLVDEFGRVALIDPNPGAGSQLLDRALLVGDLALDRSQLESRGLWRSAGRRTEWTAAFESELKLQDEPGRAIVDGFEILVRWARLRAQAGRVRAGVIAVMEGYLADAVSRSTQALGG